MKYELSVIGPCYNEAQNIQELVERLQNVFTKKKINGEIILVNDASTDNTGEIIDKYANQFQNFTACHHKKNKRMVAGWKTGLTTSRGKYICLMDTDLQNRPEDVERLYREIKNTQTDMIQGFRSTTGRARNLSLYLSRGLNTILNLIFGMHQKDNKSGFVVCRREVLEDILRYRYKYRYFQSFITVATKAKGYIIGEIETVFEERRMGESFIPKLPVKVIFWALIDLIKGFFEFRLVSKKKTNL